MIVESKNDHIKLSQTSKADVLKKVEFISYEMDRVELQASSKGESVLVLTDTYNPGWKAFVDGKETNIFPANLLFRAIYLPPGKHKVVFSYKPKWIKFIYVYFFGLTAIVVYAFWLLLQIRKKSSTK